MPPRLVPLIAAALAVSALAAPAAEARGMRFGFGLGLGLGIGVGLAGAAQAKPYCPPGHELAARKRAEIHAEAAARRKAQERKAAAAERAVAERAKSTRVASAKPRSGTTPRLAAAGGSAQVPVTNGPVTQGPATPIPAGSLELTTPSAAAVLQPSDLAAIATAPAGPGGFPVAGRAGQPTGAAEVSRAEPMVPGCDAAGVVQQPCVQ